MPRKKKIEDDEIDVQQRVVEVDPQDSKVRRLMQMMPGGLKCLQVFRYSPGSKGGRPTYIDDISPEQFDFKTMKSMFGGGKFQVKWDNEDGSISKGDFDIAGPYINFDSQPEVERTPEPVFQPTVNQPIQQTPQAFDPFQLMNMMQKAEERGEARMMKLLEMMRPQQQSPDVTKQVFEIVEKIAPMMSGGDGGGSPWMMALTQFKEPILKIVESVHVALTRQPIPQAQVIPPTQSQQSTIGNPPTQPQEDDMIKLLVKQYLPVFVNAARSGGDVGIYADMVLEQVPKNLYPKLEAWLMGTWFEDLKSIDKNIEYQAGWWNELRAYILEGTGPDAASNVQHPSDTEHGQD